MNLSKLIKSLLTIGFITTGLTAVSHAQNAGNGAAQANANSSQSKWFKICEVNPNTKKNICALNIAIPGNNGQPIASVRVIEIEGVSQKGLTIAVPPGLLIQPGMRVQIDGTKTGTAKYQICSPQACFVEARFNADFINSLKRGNEMKIIGIGQNGKQVEFPVTLAGFTAAYDGDPVDPKVAAQSQETLQQRLQRKADEARQRLLEKQKQQQN